jgi:hypothetical protein
MNKPTDFSIPTLDAATLQAPVNDLLQERGYDDVAEFLNQVATRGASFDFGAPVRIKDGDWRETTFEGRARIIFGPPGEDWICLTADREGNGWRASIQYLGHARSRFVIGQLSDAVDWSLETCRGFLRGYFEPLVTKGDQCEI